MTTDKKSCPHCGGTGLVWDDAAMAAVFDDPENRDAAGRGFRPTRRPITAQKVAHFRRVLEESEARVAQAKVVLRRAGLL